MARLTHLTRESNRARILRAGIRQTRRQGEDVGVYAMPVLPNFMASHQWLRELRKDGRPVLMAVDFIIPDSDPVLVGHYTQPHHEMTAAEAADLIMHADDPLGYEVLVPRAISPKEVVKTRQVPQVVGWRYMPGAHGRPPCGCPVCLPRGAYRARDLRERFND